MLAVEVVVVVDDVVVAAVVTDTVTGTVVDDANAPRTSGSDIKPAVLSESSPRPLSWTNTATAHSPGLTSPRS